jgi:hypothetical protein
VILSDDAPPSVLSRLLSWANENNSFVQAILCEPVEINRPLDLIPLLCRLIAGAPVIDPYLDFLERIPEYDSIDFSPAFGADVFRRLITEYPKSRARVKNLILRVLEAVIPIDRPLEVHGELMAFAARVLEEAEPGRILCTALAMLANLIPHENGEEGMAALLQRVFVKVCRFSECLRNWLMCAAGMMERHAGTVLLIPSICAKLFESVSSDVCAAETMALFQTITRRSEVNAWVLVEAGLVHFLSIWCMDTANTELQWMCMELLVCISDEVLGGMQQEVSEWVEWVLDEGSAGAKSSALLVYLRVLQLKMMNAQKDYFDSDRLRSILDLLLCGSSDDVIGIIIWIHSLITMNDEMRETLIQCGILEVLAEVREVETTGKVLAGVDKLLMALAPID